MAEASTRAMGGTVSVSRDEEFADYFRRREQSLLRTAYLLTGDVHLAEDLVQTGLTQLYSHWDDIEDRAALDGYVRKILVNGHNSFWRKGWRRREVAMTELVADRAQSLPSPADDPDTIDALWELVKTLPPKQRTVIVLRYYEDLAIDTIADLMGITPGTVKSQANRAIATLRAHPEFTDLEDWA